ncbi:MAG: hypothetical protein J6S85_19405 [Methanobrevibacter sp.]|nr:hypothetical protein [Methanobrevibacter sp.]
MSQDVMRKRIKCSNGTDVHCNVLEISVYYALGGMNYWTYEKEPRGYWISVSPLTVSGNMVSYLGFSGTKKFLNECARKSKKAEQIALEMAEKCEKELIDYVCAKHGITLEE